MKSATVPASRVARSDTRRVSLLSLASECWMLERGGDDVTATVWRFDRAAWLAEEEPWRQLTLEEELSVRDPLTADGEWRSGTTVTLCLGCHGSGIASPTALLVRSSRDAQLARVREILGGR